MKRFLYLLTLIPFVLFTCKDWNLPDHSTWIFSGIKFHTAKLYANDSCSNSILQNTFLNLYDTCNFDLFVINTEFELDCIDGNPMVSPDIVDSIKNIEITSSEDYNENNNSGKIINEVFDVHTWGNCRQDLNNYLEKNNSIPYSVQFLLKTPPDSSSVHEFIVKFYLQDTFFVATSSPVFIQN
jgi:hypothetical protein